MIKRTREDFAFILNRVVDEISKSINELYPTIEGITKLESEL